MFAALMLLLPVVPTFADDGSTRSLAVTADSVFRWNQSADIQCYIFEGNCQLSLSNSATEEPLDTKRSAERIYAVIDRSASPHLRIALLVESAGSKPVHSVIQVDSEPKFTAPWYRGKPESIPDPIPALRFALTQSQSATGTSEATGPQVQVVQYEQLPPGQLPPPLNPLLPGSPPLNNSLPTAQPLPIDSPPATDRTVSDGAMRFIIGGNRALEVLPRGASSPIQVSTRPLPATNETAVIARGGATVLVRDVQADMGTGTLTELGTISISANTIVAWIPALSGMLSGATSLDQADGELYMEGDIVFRQGDRVIYADRMYYNVAREYGMILNAEAVTSVPEFDGYVRLKADVLQQVSKGDYLAFGAAVTSSRLGVPRYWIQSEQVQFRDTPTPQYDPITGQNILVSRKSVSSSDNTVYIGGFPVLYWPVFSSNLEKSNFYLSGLKVKNDSVFGTQVLAEWDLFQLFGVDQAPSGVDWTLSTDYLSNRGPALGTNLRYSLPGLLGIPGPVTGNMDVWSIYDEGFDNLGSDRRRLLPERDVRGRVLLRHRHFLPNDFELIAEVGVLSDRNFLEQYLENEWDSDKDHDTGIRLRKYYLNNLIDFHADVRVNDFYTDTNRLPQLDHYNIGSSWFGDRLLWSAHNKVGYANLEVADPPTNALEIPKYSTLSGEVEREGIVASTRQELAAPFLLGALNVTPYISGEAAHWGEDVNGEELTRLLGQAGVRTSLPAWRLYPTVQSSLLNVNGIAHKTELVGELFYADSNQNFDLLPAYDALDDDAQEQFRRRLLFNTFGGTLPAQFDYRNYAFRQGMQRYVAAPSTEVADDLLQAKVGFNQRFQTKRGLPGRERIVDLVRLDVNTLLFANEDQSNFDEVIGPTRYDFRYHLGDRVSLLSDGYFDWFDNGLHSVSAGILTSRPGLGNVYLGILSLEGPISSTVLRGNLDYRLNEKWIASAGATFDLGEIGNVGQQFSLTRIGESMLVQLGMNVDAGRDNVGFQFMVEPRLWPKRRLGRLGGRLIPPPGIEGLE
jgi:hypothetical protein